MTDRIERLPAVIFQRLASPPFAFAEAHGASLEVTGLACEALVERPEGFWQALSDDDARRLRSALQEAAASGSPYAIDYRLRAPDGRTRSLREQGRPFPDESGRTLAWDGIIVDLGARASTAGLDEQSSERFRAIAENARDAVAEITPDARLLFVSPSFTELFGYRPEEVLGKNALELIHPDDLAQVEEIRVQAMAEERPVQLTFRFRHANGSWRWIELTGRPYHTRSGEQRAVLIARDVTERVQAEAALQEQLALETRIADVARTFLHLDPDQRDRGFQRGLEAAAELAGADRAQFLYLNRDHKTVGGHHQWCAPGIAMRPTIEQADSVGHYRWGARRLLAGETLHVPDPAKLPDEARTERESMQAEGTRSYLGIPIRHGDQTVGFLDFFRMRSAVTWTESEISRLRLVSELFSIALRRLQSEQDRAASEERFRTIAENVRDAICEFSLDGRFLYANAGFGRISGYSKEELAGMDPLTLVHADDRGQLDRRIRTWESAEDVGELLRYRVLARDGTWRCLESTASGYRTAADEERIALVIRDVTEQESRKVDLERRLELENRIAEIARSFVAIDAGDVDEAIRQGLEAAAAIAGADRAYLVCGSDRKNGSVQFHDWCAPGVAPRPNKLGLADSRKQAWATQRLLAGELVRVPKVGDLPDEARHVRESLMEAEVRSFLGIPVLIGQRMAGVLGFHCLEEQSWSDHEINLLRLVAELFTGAARRKEAEADLRESETRFRTLAEHARDPICEIDEQGKILYASPSVTELFGIEPDELAGMDFASLIHLDDIARIYRRCGPQLNTEGSGPVQFRARSGDGSWLHIEATARVFTGAEGDRRSVCVMRDVTERHRSQVSLERQLEMETRIADLSQRFLAAAVDEIDDALRDSLRVLGAVAEADRTWLYHLDAGAPGPQEVIEWCAPEVESHRNRLAATQPNSFPWATPQLLRGEVVHVPDPAELPDAAAIEREDLGRRGVRSFLGIPLHSGARPVGFLGFETVREHRLWSVETITLLRLVGDIFVSALRRKRAEEQLQKSQHQLLQAQKMEAVGALAGGIAHDFNNQLTVMLGNARHVLRNIEDAELRDALTDLERAAEHCSQLTRSLLAFSRRSAGSPRPLDVDRALVEVEELLRPLIPSAIAFRVEPCGDAHPVAADATQLQQVIVNLAVNARDAMPGGGELLIRTRNRRVDAEGAERFGLPRPGAYVEIGVIDTGTGMDEETLGRIFEPFFTTKALGEGTGLGLATAYGIVQESGGAILVDTRQNEGTTFRVLLPRSEKSAEASLERAPTDPGPASGTILLVEDEAAVRRVVRRGLESMGYRVLEATDGEDALRVVGANEPVSALVTDLDMPRMDGLELAARLAADRPDLPVVYVSASSRDIEHEGQCRVPGARFLQKPFSESSLREILQELRVGKD